VGEFDGADHRAATRHSRDVDREAGFRNHDLEFFRVTGPDIPITSRVVNRMVSTRERAKWLGEGIRTWTIRPPRGSGPEETLDEYLDERDWKRTLYEQYEREGNPGIHELMNM